MAIEPLASRMRPSSIEDVVGQPTVNDPGSPIHRLISGDKTAAWSSIILWGPPGSGKTTIARLLSSSSNAHFSELSAISAGVAQVREVIEEAKGRRDLFDRSSVLFLDEIHRFSKAQQDALLAAVESGVITLIAATTENPSFSIIRPLISRSLVFELKPLSEQDIAAVLNRALNQDHSLAKISIAPEAIEYLARLSTGDARRALTMLEAAVGQSGGDLVTVDHVKASSRLSVPYDQAGDQHYDTISAFIKSVRGSDTQAAVHYLARMIEGGEDPRFIARRLIILAAEDIGLADPQALPLAVAAAEAVALIGMPEGRIPLAEATIYLSLAPKSNRAYAAINAAIEDVRQGLVPEVPAPLRSSGAVGYRYPHDDPRGILPQDYAAIDKRYYTPSEFGLEAQLGARIKTIEAILRAERDN